MKSKTDFPNKPFEMVTTLFSLPRQKEKQPNSDELLTDKAAITTLTQILAHSSVTNAQKILCMIGELIYFVINAFMKMKHSLTAMEQFLITHKKHRGRNLFKISEPTLNTYLDTLRPESLDTYLAEQNVKLSQKSTKQGIDRKTVSFAIDPTVREYTGKYPNQCQPKGYIGQQEKYRTAYSEQTIYDSTNQLILSSKPKMNLGTRYKNSILPMWISDLQTNIERKLDLNQNIKAIYGDREYYQGIGAAFAYLGWNVPNLSLHDAPRICFPKKLRKKELKKLDFLLDPTSKQVFTDSIELNYYHQSILGNALTLFPSNASNTRYNIPVAIVATFDSYSNRRKKKDLGFARQKAQEYKNQLDIAEKELNQAINQYDQFCKSLSRKYNGKKTNFGGSRRSVFKYIKEKALYFRCCQCWDRKKRYKKKLTNLLKRLMFFVVSLKPRDDLNGISEELIEISKGYHQRWGVESAFRSLKGSFWIPCQKRSVQARHTRFIISSLLFNAWHYSRISRFNRKSEYSAKEIRAIKRWKKTDDKKKMGELIQSESAGAFLIETWGFGLKSILKRQIKS
jgi:hypothetical protein